MSKFLASGGDSPIPPVGKTLYPLIRKRTCAYQGVRNNSFSEYFCLSTRSILEHIEIKGNIDLRWVNPFQSSAAFHIETTHLICTANYDWFLHEMQH